MAQNYASSIQGAAVRVTRLAADGSLATGATAAYVTPAFIRVSFTPEFAEGEDIEEKAADGSVCVSYRTNDTLKRVTLEVAICEPDPEFTEIIAGGTILTDGTTVSRTISNKALTSNVATLTTSAAHTFTVGQSVVVAGVDSTFNGTYTITGTPTSTTFTYALTAADVTSTAATGTADVTSAGTTIGYAAPVAGVDSNPNGACLEVWSKAIANGRQAGTNPYWHWMFPYVQLRPTGERVIENGLLANTFSGWGVGNDMVQNGTPVHPTAAWPFVTDRPYQYARAATAPVGAKGYVTIAA
jgi:hypothetical protein